MELPTRSGSRRLRRLRLAGAPNTPVTIYGKDTVPWELMVIALGASIALVSVPGEPFTETAQAIASQSPFAHTLVSGYSNGGFGYIPTRAAFGEGGYETEATPFSEDAADTLTTEAVRLLNELHKEQSHAGLTHPA